MADTWRVGSVMGALVTQDSDRLLRARKGSDKVERPYLGSNDGFASIYRVRKVGKPRRIEYMGDDLRRVYEGQCTRLPDVTILRGFPWKLQGFPQEGPMVDLHVCKPYPHHLRSPRNPSTQLFARHTPARRAGALWAAACTRPQLSFRPEEFAHARARPCKLAREHIHARR